MTAADTPPWPPCRLVRPTQAHLSSYLDALRRGWSADTIRGGVAAEEELAAIADDAALFLARMDNRRAEGGPVLLPDGRTAERLPSLRRWLWEVPADAVEDPGMPADIQGRHAGRMPTAAGAFCGSFSLRWAPGGRRLPAHVLGHIGYSVVPWKQRRGHGTAGLGALLTLARAEGLRSVELTTDPDNLASQKVITANGGRLVERFKKPRAYGGQVALRFRIDLPDPG